MKDKTPAQEILQRALNLLQDKEFREKNPLTMKVITQDLIDDLQRRCDA